VSPTGPTPAVGHFMTWFDVIATAPQVTVGLTGHGHAELTPIYPSPVNDTPKFSTGRRLRVAADTDLQAGGDVRGALIVAQPASLDALVADMSQAAAAGAAGVLVLPTGDFPSFPWYLSPSSLKVPLLWVDGAQAAQVLRVLGDDGGGATAQADVRSQLATSYEYKLVYYLRGAIPDSLTFRPRPADLTRIQTIYHAEYAAPADAWGPAMDMWEVDHTSVPGQPFSFKVAHQFSGPAGRVEYYNSTGSDVTWFRQYAFQQPDLSSCGGTATATCYPYRFGQSYRGFTSATSGQEEWNGAALPAAWTAGPQVPTGARAAQSFVCDGCRQGDSLYVRSFGEMAEADDQSHASASGGTEEVHLFHDGTELTPQRLLGAYPYYVLPGERGGYRLTDTYTDGFAGQRLARTVRTEWTFTSARPATGDDDPNTAPYICPGTRFLGDQDPCAWQPLIYLGYHLGLGPDDTVPGDRPYGFTVTAQDGRPGAAELAGLRLWTSTDDGAHWSAAHVVPAPGHAYRVVPAAPTGGAAQPGSTTQISIKAQAWDAAGSSVRQTIDDAYSVTNG
jgi:hypothetical protein